MTLTQAAKKRCQERFPNGAFDRLSPAVRAHELEQDANYLRSAIYTTTYCNHGHRVFDGKPVAHECYVLPPAALDAEMDGDYLKANDLIAAAQPMRVVRGR